MRGGIVGEGQRLVVGRAGEIVAEAGQPRQAVIAIAGASGARPRQRRAPTEIVVGDREEAGGRALEDAGQAVGGVVLISEEIAVRMGKARARARAGNCFHAEARRTRRKADSHRRVSDPTGRL